MAAKLYYKRTSDGTLQELQLPLVGGFVNANTAITAGTHTKISYDSKGLVTGGSDLLNSDVTTALGFTPENSSNKVTSWSNTTTDTNYPSEKLVKDSLDNKVPISGLEVYNTLRTKYDDALQKYILKNDFPKKKFLSYI